MDRYHCSSNNSCYCDTFIFYTVILHFNLYNPTFSYSYSIDGLEIVDIYSLSTNYLLKLILIIIHSPHTL